MHLIILMHVNYMKFFDFIAIEQYISIYFSNLPLDYQEISL